MSTFTVSPPGTAATLDNAYRGAVPGDLIVMNPGNYVAQTINPDATKVGPGRVEIAANGLVFVGADNAQSIIHGSWITWKGIEFLRISTSGTSRPTGHEFLRCHLHTFNGSRFENLLFRHFQIGPNKTFTSRTGIVATTNSDDGMFFGAANGKIPKGIVLEHGVVTDIQRPLSTSHSDGIQFTCADGVTTRNLRTKNCQDASILFKRDQGVMQNIVVENCDIDPPTNPTATTGFMFSNGNTSTGGGSGGREVKVRGNRGDPAKLLLSNIAGCEAHDNIWTPVTTYNCGQYVNVHGWNVHDNISLGGEGCGTDSMVVV